MPGVAHLQQGDGRSDDHSNSRAPKADTHLAGLGYRESEEEKKRVAARVAALSLNTYCSIEKLVGHCHLALQTLSIQLSEWPGYIDVCTTCSNKKQTEGFAPTQRASEKNIFDDWLEWLSITLAWRAAMSCTSSLSRKLIRLRRGGAAVPGKQQQEQDASDKAFGGLRNPSIACSAQKPLRDFGTRHAGVFEQFLLNPFEGW